jgi:DNA-binding XRE family transcriptional regulator
MTIKDKFDGWKVIDNELLKERRKQMIKPFNTKKKMAQEIKIHRNRIKQYEDLKKYPSLKTFKKLCLYLQLSADDLLGLVGDSRDTEDNSKKAL